MIELTPIVTRVERHIIKKGRYNYSEIASICRLSKNLYNYANYLVRQEFFVTGKIPKEYDLSKTLANSNQVDYRALPAQTAQQTIKQVFRDWKSYFKAIKAYAKDPSKFTGKPRIPKYKKKDGTALTCFTSQQLRLKDGKINLVNKVIKPITTKVSSIKQVRLVPKTSCFVVEIVYDKTVTHSEKIKGSVASIDLGVNAFVTYLDDTGESPFIVNGKGAKSYNRFYHKEKAFRQSLLPEIVYMSNELRRLELNRKLFMENFTHQAARVIVNALLQRKIETLVIGYNEGWKQEVNHGKTNNQNFVSLPYLSFIAKLKNKCEEYGINVVMTEESYTSKIDHLAREKMEHKEKYLGRRKHRGLFVSSTGRTIQADVNGALGIMLKVFPEKIERFIGNRGVALTPVVIHPISYSPALARTNRIRKESIKISA